MTGGGKRNGIELGRDVQHLFQMGEAVERQWPVRLELLRDYLDIMETSTCSDAIPSCDSSAL